MQQTNIVFSLAAATMLSACATSMPVRPAVTSFDRADCPSAADTLSAVSLVPEKDKAIWVVERGLVSAGPCFKRGEDSAPYLVFELPGEAHAKMVEIGSVLEYVRVLSPKVVLLDADGNETREFARDQYMFRPGLLSVQFVPRQNERFALVTVDAEAVGSKQEGIVSSTSTSTYYNGFGASNWTSGQETMMSRKFSYEGIVRALVYRPDKED